MSNKNNLSPKRAAQFSIFDAKQKQKKATIEAIWARANNCCEVCGKPVQRPGQAFDIAQCGVIAFTDMPTMDDQLRCQKHAIRR